MSLSASSPVRPQQMTPQWAVAPAWGPPPPVRQQYSSTAVPVALPCQPVEAAVHRGDTAVPQHVLRPMSHNRQAATHMTIRDRQACMQADTGGTHTPISKHGSLPALTIGATSAHSRFISTTVAQVSSIHSTAKQVGSTSAQHSPQVPRVHAAVRAVPPELLPQLLQPPVPLSACHTSMRTPPHATPLAPGSPRPVG